MNEKILPALLLFCWGLTACQPSDRSKSLKPWPGANSDNLETTDSLVAPGPLHTYLVPRDIRVGEYFPFIDSLVQQFDSLCPYPLTEHLLVRNNWWIVDSLFETDYYRRQDRGEFVFDQRLLPVLHAGDTIFFPDSSSAAALQQRIDSTSIDINIPEFTLRILEGSDTLECMTIRVGQNKKRFQQVLGRVQDLRTQPGVGKIVRINRSPSLFVDPHTGRKFEYTKRDDGQTTRMPLIPWLEPEINGIRLGQMIHPTTNPETLGRAYSNGCIGCTEGEAWRVYYYAPVGTKVVVRYDLLLISPKGDSIRLPDIYGWAKPD
ncbi:MAG: L,D-transpeptidase [Saprospiraceae bacterium]|nr:L,D-transpeptidase [Saprospiraceae bacterium]